LTRQLRFILQCVLFRSKGKNISTCLPNDYHSSTFTTSLQELIFVTFVFAMIDQSYDIIMIDYLFSNSSKWLSFFHLHYLRINNTINSSVNTINRNFHTVYIGTKIKITSRFQTETKRVLRTGIQQHCLDNLHFMTYIFRLMFQLVK
jgi:hypothetical protein